MNYLRLQTVRVVILVVSFMFSSERSVFAQSNPTFLLLSQSGVEKLRGSHTDKKAEFSRDIANVLKAAEKGLSALPVSVMSKPQIPPSGDKHDYMSMAPYWWTNPDTPDGLPYVRRDGETNPERNTYTDRKNIDVLFGNVPVLALAYAISGEEKYAAHAARFIRVWFLDTETRMNPNLNFAQSIPGRNLGRGAGIIDFRRMIEILDGINLIRKSSAWSESDESQMNAWLRAYLTWLRESKNGTDELKAQNNHGTWYDVQVASLMLYLGEREEAKEFISSVKTRRIEIQIETDGTQPKELVRTKSWGYSLLNLEGLLALSILGEQVGVEVWNYTSPDGRSIRKGLDYLIPFGVGEKNWEWKQIVSMDLDRLARVLKVVTHRFKDPTFKTAIAKIRGDESKDDKYLFSTPMLH